MGQQGRSWSAADRRNWFADDPATIMHRRGSAHGQHIEQGIAETILVCALGELGSTWSRWGQPLLPFGMLYNPFIERALERWSFGIYSGGQSILVGRYPSGVSLAAEGGAHQSIKTPSIGLEQPGCTMYELAFVLDTEWVLLACLGRQDGRSAYLRLSTRPVAQALAAVPTDSVARERRRTHVVAGGYVLRRFHLPRDFSSWSTAAAPSPQPRRTSSTVVQDLRLGRPADTTWAAAPLGSTSHVQRVRNTVIARIDDHTYSPGTRIIAVALAEQLGVSTGAFWHALAALVAQGRLRSQRGCGQGYVVTESGPAPPWATLPDIPLPASSTTCCHGSTLRGEPQNFLLA